MKRLALILLVIVSMAGSASAQFKADLSSRYTFAGAEQKYFGMTMFSDPDQERVGMTSEKMSAGEKLLWLGAAHMVFTTYDVILYPIIAGQENGKNLPLYRVSQLVLQALITDQLIKITGDWKVGVAFNVQWWTWNDDLLYYMMYDALHGAHAYKDQVSGGKVTWASWTPYGLVRGEPKRAIPEKALLIQALIGFSVGVTITVL